MSRVGAVVLTAVLVVACSSGSSGSTDSVDPPVEATSEPTTEPLVTAPSRPPSNLRVSDAVPTLDELRNMGIGDGSAKCFIAIIDPDDTGRVTSVDLFIEALAACF
jgi:hypothetical protein